MKIVVFDLDETLGYFTQFGIFWDALSFYITNNNNSLLSQNDFNKILDLFPHFLRPNIINILNYLKIKKQNKCCYKIIIYTNNNSSRDWSQYIIQYFEQKIQYKLIDQIIAAFKINGITNEICRTTHHKTHNDFMKCTQIPINAEICFLDDTFYPQMATEQVYYINIKPYYFNYTFEYMLDKFYANSIGKILINTINTNSNFKHVMMKQINLYNYKYINKNVKEYELDKNVGKHIIQHLKYFFNKNKTKRHRNSNYRKTRKKCKHT